MEAHSRGTTFAVSAAFFVMGLTPWLLVNGIFSEVRENEIQFVPINTRSRQGDIFGFLALRSHSRALPTYKILNLNLCLCISTQIFAFSRVPISPER